MTDTPDMLDDAMYYLLDGGLAETEGFAWAAMRLGAEKVQMDTAHAIALCRLAREALDRRAAG